MIARLFALLMLAVASPTSAQGGDFTIGDQHIQPADIVDARAIPDLEGPPVIMITFNDAGVGKLMAATRGGNTGLTIMVPVAIDGEKLTDLVTTEVRGDAVLTITARGRSIAQAEALAKRISGKDPVPEEFAE